MGSMKNILQKLNYNNPNKLRELVKNYFSNSQEQLRKKFEEQIDQHYVWELHVNLLRRMNIQYDDGHEEPLINAWQKAEKNNKMNINKTLQAQVAEISANHRKHLQEQEGLLNFKNLTDSELQQFMNKQAELDDIDPYNNPLAQQNPEAATSLELVHEALFGLRNINIPGAETSTISLHNNIHPTPDVKSFNNPWEGESMIDRTKESFFRMGDTLGIEARNATQYLYQGNINTFYLADILRKYNDQFHAETYPHQHQYYVENDLEQQQQEQPKKPGYKPF